MAPCSELGLDLAQLGAHSLGVSDALEIETPLPILRADVREAEEGERLRLAETSLLTSLGGKPTELDQPRLLGVQLQEELREPVAQLLVEPFGVIPVLEAHHEVIGETHDHYVPVRVPGPPLVSPQVENMMQIHVRQERRN